MPADGSGQEFGLLGQFLAVVFAEVEVGVGLLLVEGEDVGRGFEFGDGYEADRAVGGEGGEGLGELGEVGGEGFGAGGGDLHVVGSGLLGV